ncbi:MAG: hypothetical protein AAB514_02940 [Patescibacteria group bacterium]
MAIIVEEPKPPKNWGTIIGVIIVIAIFFFGIYFLFFKKPILIEAVIPAPLRQTQQLSKAKFDPASVSNSEVFKNLRPYSILPTATSGPGRPNPFSPF